MSRLLIASFETVAAPVALPPPLPFENAFVAAIRAADRVAHALLGGQPVTYAPQDGAPVSVTGMFDAIYVLAKGTAEAGVEALGPAVFLRLEDLPVDPEDDEPILTINGAEYRVVERRPDGIGGIVLALRLLS